MKTKIFTNWLIACLISGNFVRGFLISRCGRNQLRVFADWMIEDVAAWPDYSNRMVWHFDRAVC
ncbi:hypothetical protein PQR36_35680 [Paraburkholderia nemoris]|uniref:hypothetical protein n=1 Tax=Paraburkholderia nemoris TaxID=2793076 RepID=UPI0038BA5105